MRIYDNDGDVHQSVVAIRGIWRPKGAIWGQRVSRGFRGPPCILMAFFFILIILHVCDFTHDEGIITPGNKKIKHVCLLLLPASG
jgi:hypothetical protein